MEKIENFRCASEVLQNVISKTSLIYSECFSQSSGNRVYLKPENMQVTGSFKIRGAYYKISRLTAEQKKGGLITSSAGNHAQGVALAASLTKTPATIVMPVTTPLVKVNNTKNYGANVILHGDYFDMAFEHAMSLSESEGYEFIHAFNDLDIAIGQGTIGYEILKDLPDTEYILVPIGGGGLAAGIATLVKLLNPHVKVIGVEPKGAASMTESIKNGKIKSLDKLETIADGVAVKTPGDRIFPYIQKNLDDIIVIDDYEIIETFLDMMESHKMIVENSGLLAVAALKHLNVKGKNVVPVLSGGNMDVITISSLVQHGLINRGRIFSFNVLIPDRPGEMMKISGILAAANANIVKLEHNQMVNINRSAAIELRVTLEAFGHDHRELILKSLTEHGYEPKLSYPTSIYSV